MFRINQNELPEAARNVRTMNALYTALHMEFRGAQVSDKYSKMTTQEKMTAIEDFAQTWLKRRGFK